MVMEDPLGSHWQLSAAAAMFPFLGFLWAHDRGLTTKMFSFAYKRFGIGGFFALPFMTLAMEKSIYDTTTALQGKDMTKSFQGEKFPHGGAAMLGSFSLIPVQTEGPFVPKMIPRSQRDAQEAAAKDA